MPSTPANPVLVLIPSEVGALDYKALYTIATAYAHSGLLISSHGEQTDRPEFSFPAIVCSSFAIELFMKFFLIFDKAGKDSADQKRVTGHILVELWSKIKPEHQRLIAGMFRNSTGTPLLNASDRRIVFFEEALTSIGKAPFLNWRYVHELSNSTIMSHGSITEVLDALGHAAEYIMQQSVNTA